MSLNIPRRQYADLYGPTTGDRIRLADTELFIEIEKDLTTPGEEAKFGGGKVIRDGMGQSSTATSADGALDLVITNAVIVDHGGIYKADIGIRHGRMVGIGKAGICLGEARIRADRAIEIADCRPQAIGGALVQEVTALEIILQRSGIDFG